MNPTLILKICACIIIVGLVILAIDKFVVRRGEPSQEQRLEQLTDDLALANHSDDETVRQRLQAILTQHEDITGRGIEVHTILNRADAGAQLWLVEFSSREFALYRGKGQTSQVDVRRLAIVIEFAESTDLLSWSQESAEAPSILSAEARQRLQRMDDFRMAMAHSHVLFASQLETLALLQATNQSVSSEFHAGLLNSALRIDVQRALDIVNLLDADLPTQSRFYSIDVPTLEIDMPDAIKISAGINEIAQETEAKIAAQREQWERQNAERKAQWEATLAANRQQSERKNAERKAESERRRAEINQRMRESIDRAKNGTSKEDDSSEQ